MNVFRLSNNPEQCAKYHCDKHTNKMLVEGVQIINTALYLNSYPGELPYKPTQMNHPIIRWCSESFKNFLFVCHLCDHLHEEWKFRYNHEDTKIHKSMAILNRFHYTELAQYFDKVYEETPQPKVMPDYIANEYDDVVEAYRAYYIQIKSEFAEWKRGREKPEWFKTELISA